MTPLTRRKELLDEYTASGVTMAGFAEARLPWAAAENAAAGDRLEVRLPDGRSCAGAAQWNWPRRSGHCEAKAMLAFPAAVRIYVVVQPVDMRQSFNGLWRAASEELHEDPKKGAVLAFINRERTRLRLIYWERTGV